MKQSTLTTEQRKIARSFLQSEYRDYAGYSALLNIEKNPEFRAVLEKLIEHEKEDIAFWQEVLGDEKVRVSSIQIWLWKMMRRVLGLTFTAKYLELGERKAAAKYESVKDVFGPERAERIIDMMEHEREHEKELINQIQEEKVEFLSNIVLGLNDGLIELSGALVGFSFALGDPALIGSSGLITGIAASLSMASSAYLQSKHEDDGKEPKKAALYTGGAYAIVVFLLVVPFFLFATSLPSLLIMGALVFAIIAGMSGYSAVLFNRPFASQFKEMAMLTIGTGVVAFLLGLLVDAYLLN